MNSKDLETITVFFKFLNFDYLILRYESRFSTDNDAFFQEVIDKVTGDFTAELESAIQNQGGDLSNAQIVSASTIGNLWKFQYIFRNET